MTLISEPRLWMVVSSYKHIYVDMIAIRCNQHVMLHIISIHLHTVDGRNPAPPGMYKTL